MMMRTHCQTSGASLTEKDPYNNVIRTTIEGMAGVFGGTQSLHTNSFDEAMALPTDASARIARNTQIILQEEANLTNVVDPLGGSFYVESLTDQLVQEAWKIITEIEDVGGMTKAVSKGLPKLDIEKAAAMKQARIDMGEETVVGVNKHRLVEEEEINILRIDNLAVRKIQIKKLEVLRKERDDDKCQAALKELTNAAAGSDNLLEKSIVAARARATLGEISDAMEEVFGRHRAEIKSISGIYGAAYKGDKDYVNIQNKIEAFAEKVGRRPRILVAKMGQDGHDRGAKIIATAFADIGFDVDVGPLFQTPVETAREAIENDVHIIGVSSQAAGHKTLIPSLINALRVGGADDILVVAGGVIPTHDYDELYKAGVSAIFGPGTNIPDAASKVIDVLEEKL